MGTIIHHRIVTFLSVLLAISICLAVGSYYLASKGQVSYFPTYLAGILFLALLGLNFDRNLIANPISAACLVLMTYLMLTPLWGIGGITASIRYFGYTLMLFAFVYGIPMLNQRDQRFLDLLVSTIIGASVASATLSIYLFYTVNFHPIDDQGRMYGIGRMANPVVAALSYSLPFLFAVHQSLTQRRILASAIWGASALILLHALMLTGTRSIWVAMICALCAVVIADRQYTLKQRLTVIACTSLVAMIALGIAFGMGKLEPMLARATSYRPEIWSAILEVFNQGNRFFGSGIAADSSVEYGPYVFVHPHSVYLATLFYGGLVGLLLLLGTIAIAVRNVFVAEDSKWRLMAIAALSFGATVLSLDGDRLLAKLDYVWIVFWLPLAFSICVTSSAKVLAAESSQE